MPRVILGQELALDILRALGIDTSNVLTGTTLVMQHNQIACVIVRRALTQDEAVSLARHISQRYAVVELAAPAAKDSHAG